MVVGTAHVWNGEYTVMDEECDGMPVWSKPCQGVSSGGEMTNKCYIFRETINNHAAWNLSPDFCINSWMTTCQHFTHIEKFACKNHPMTQSGMEQFDQVAGWPWEEKRWVNNWWETIEMSCIPI